MGPLAGVRVLEMSGIGPAPFCGMLLADMGAEVLRIDRPGDSDHAVVLPAKFDFLGRNKHSVAVDLKSASGRGAVLQLAAHADILIEGYRPGVMERLGLGPEDCWPLNPRLVYGRMTGWGQQGPLSQAAGHDLNYIAIAGALDAIGRKGQKPTVPLNLVGDFGGGALYLAIGVLAALLEARTSCKGQVVDAAMVDGVSSLMTVFHALRQAQLWSERRGENLFDGGAPFYDVYETKDGRYLSVAPLEPRFYKHLLVGLGLGDAALPAQDDRAAWDKLCTRFAEVIKTRTCDEWCAQFEGSDACVAPVLDLMECRHHPHLAARGSFIELDGAVHPAPAPRFSRTASELRHGAPEPGQDGAEALRGWGLPEDEVEKLVREGLLAKGR